MVAIGPLLHFVGYSFTLGILLYNIRRVNEDVRPIGHLRTSNYLPHFTFFNSIEFTLLCVFFGFGLPVLVQRVYASFLTWVFHLRNYMALMVVTIISTLRVSLSTVRVVNRYIFRGIFSFGVFCQTTLRYGGVVFFVRLTPVGSLVGFNFRGRIRPGTNTTPITLPGKINSVRFRVLLSSFVGDELQRFVGVFG